MDKVFQKFLRSGIELSVVGVENLKNCSYKKEASAVGAAKYFFTKHMVEL